jgi:hypothetical protein
MYPYALVAGPNKHEIRHFSVLSPFDFNSLEVDCEVVRQINQRRCIDAL